MIYWFKDLPFKPLRDDIWKPVIPYKWLRENFMAAVYILQFVLFALFMLYINVYIPKGLDSAPVVIRISIPKSLIYLSVILVWFIHEIIHIAVIFNKGDFSVTFKNLFFWINTNAELSKFRYLIFISLPLLVLTAIPFVISLFMFNNLTYVLRIYAFYNLIISPADIINIIFILPKPNKAIFYGGMYSI